MFNNIKIGDRLEITLLKDRKIGKVHVSQVEEIMPNNNLLVHMPISYGQLVKLSTKERYGMLFFTDKGMINFEAEIIGFKKETEFSYMIVHISSEGERMQRREFFRFASLLPVKFAVINDENAEEAKISEETLYDGIVKDLGGGGIRFVTNESFDEKIKVKCVLMLGDNCLITVGKVLHKQCFPKANYKYQYRIEFVGISPPEQEEIIQYIFNEQRKIIQRTRG